MPYFQSWALCYFVDTVVDPEWYNQDPDPTFQVVPDRNPDPTLKTGPTKYGNWHILNAHNGSAARLRVFKDIVQ
jgi:hypothetical protein